MSGNGKATQLFSHCFKESRGRQAGRANKPDFSEHVDGKTHSLEMGTPGWDSTYDLSGV